MNHNSNCPLNCTCSQQPQEIWKTQLEYCLPDWLTEEDKQTIRNNVALILQAQEEKETILELLEKEYNKAKNPEFKGGIAHCINLLNKK